MVEPSAILSEGVQFMDTFVFILLGLFLLGVGALAYWLSRKGKASIPILTKYDYKLTIFEPSTAGVISRTAKARKFIDMDEITYLEISEGFMKKPSRLPMPQFEFISADKQITLWSPTSDEFYPCKTSVVGTTKFGKTAKLNAQIDKSMMLVYAHTQEKIAARNREKSWMETMMPLFGVLLLGIICLMFIYVTWSQSGAYMANVADSFVQASNNFACPAAMPPI